MLHLRYLLVVALCALPRSFANINLKRRGADVLPSNETDSTRPADCWNTTIPVSINTTNVQLLRGPPANQYDLSQLIQDVSDGIFTSTELDGPMQEAGNFAISARLCLPRRHRNSRGGRTIQVLTHGIGFDKTYWDIAPGYSFQDAAAQAGYATLAYDKLGTGESDHPDPVKVVQGPADVEVLHAIITQLRCGALGPRFDKIVGVGHSVGSITQIGNNAKYPADMDISVLTGVSDTLQFLPLTLLSTTPVIAKGSDPSRFGNLSSGYVVNPSFVSFAQPFFLYDNYEPSILQLVAQNRGTYSLGLISTVGSAFAPAPAFDKPVAVQLGDRDFSFCGPSCLQPTNRAQAALATFYPNATNSSQSFVVNQTGHAINAHFNRNTSFSQIFHFIAKNGC